MQAKWLHFLNGCQKYHTYHPTVPVCGSPEEIMRIIAITVMHHAIQPGSLKRISFSKQLISVWINSHLSHVTPV